MVSTFVRPIPGDPIDAGSERSNPALDPRYDHRPSPASWNQQAVRRAQFARIVSDAIESGVLRFSRREKLLKQAADLGIGRFEANLLIATVQHRRSMGSSPARSRTFQEGWWVYLLAATMTQGLIILGMWGLLRA